MAELTMLADIQWTYGLPRGGHSSTARHGEGHEKFASHRPTLCYTSTTTHRVANKKLDRYAKFYWVLAHVYHV